MLIFNKLSITVYYADLISVYKNIHLITVVTYLHSLQSAYIFNIYHTCLHLLSAHVCCDSIMLYYILLHLVLPLVSYLYPGSELIFFGPCVVRTLVCPYLLLPLIFLDQMLSYCGRCCGGLHLAFPTVWDFAYYYNPIFIHTYTHLFRSVSFI
jgi:hypothetical protein